MSIHPIYTVSEVHGDDWAVTADRDDAAATVANRIAQSFGRAPYELLENGRVIATIVHRPTAARRWNCEVVSS